MTATTVPFDLKNLICDEVGVLSDWIEDQGDMALADYVRRLVEKQSVYPLRWLRPTIAKRDIVLRKGEDVGPDDGPGGISFQLRHYPMMISHFSDPKINGLVAEAAEDYVEGKRDKFHMLLALCGRHVRVMVETPPNRWRFALEDDE